MEIKGKLVTGIWGVKQEIANKKAKSPLIRNKNLLIKFRTALNLPYLP